MKAERGREREIDPWSVRIVYEEGEREREIHRE